MSDSSRISRPVRVVVVDDSATYIRALAASLRRVPSVEIIGYAQDAEEGLALVQDRLPDVVLIDVRMPRIAGRELARIMTERVPGVDSIALTVSQDGYDLLEMLRAGARGYVLKTASADEIAAAILAVSRGESWLSPKMAAKLIDEFTSLPAGRLRDALPEYGKLTPREYAVLRELALGRTNREISKALGIAETTVKTHLKNILEKLQARNRVEAALIAVEQYLERE